MSANKYNVDISDVTLATFEGTGAFDVMMKSMKLHLQEEYSSGRITGDKYAEAYVAITSQVLAQAVQFALQSKLMSQKVKTEAAQTEDSVDGNTVTGSIGKQKEVHTAQAKGFKDDAMIKAAKQHFDAFAVSLSNEAVSTIPTAFNDAAINSMMSKMIAQVTK